MGRHKTKIEYIADERMRQLMFLKRKQAINRKLWEISVVCGVECLAVYFASNGKMFAFSSTGSLDDTMLRYCAYDEPHEVRTVADVRPLVKLHDR
ncbi:myocyte enhancer factor 2D [Catenaria anguillulae PL171]|uniref:Myocyte enhancer factor 2D n=1 Tax=Catenaria anguillulae PL171 TaxID=765915 RepID=A0A1Y2I039_9FUNG|nr:myocyte enhancer factor 2D [Catenaria anguillulae PL171]